MNSDFPYTVTLQKSFKDNLFTINSKKSSQIAGDFMDWLSTQARLKPVPDLQSRIARMEVKLQRMAENLRIEFRDGAIVIKTDAESESLLNLLRRGSDWFDPHPDVNAAILAALANSPQFS